MQLNDEVKGPHGHWKIEIFAGDERTPETLLETLEGDNVITTNGKNLLLDRLFAAAGFGGPVNSMGVGATNTAAVAGDTQLGTTPTLQALDTVPPTRAGQVVTCVSTFATGSANIIWAELALFNGTVNGTSVMFNRIAPIGPFTKTSSVSIVVSVTISQS